MAKDRYAPKTLDDLMAGMSNKITSYAGKNQKLSHFQVLLEESISVPMAKKCRVSNYRDAIMVIETDSAAVAMRLNYMKMSILSDLRKNGLPELSQIKVQTNPQAFTNRAIASKQKENNAHKKDLVLSEDTANSLLDIAKNAPPSLREKLEKLARHSKK
ncbi:RNA-binding protein [Pseudoalteromonas sp. NBT06-2]|uniref:DUF721 domain-containing protein n=1 Tax=Pseudoalteromonas sp. NBT06-2 TaxID=2025950 RepID=UPI000BA7A82D|nr:DciA family protein [Pseudoalteromonas sp. NBT06-2]PAJ74118.1 RNA-binding protein [Pseudoalteromonas sp. NBT06-2]